LPELTFLGTGGSYVTQDRVCSGVYVGGSLLDCGFGVLTNLRKAGIPLDSIDRVFISHTHADHIGDFTGLVWAMGLGGRRSRLKVVSSRETAAVLRQVMDLQSTPPHILDFGIDFLEPAEAGVRYCTAIHTPTDYAYRIQVSGKAITYTGDTALSGDVIELAKGGDLLIHDSMYLAAAEHMIPITKHSSARQAVGAAREAGVRRLALTHLAPGAVDHDYEQEARGAGGVDFVVAKDLLRITV
jgi:ribonuclease BN (tRNA processing enzyme)